jgi:hypothetical protein
LGIPQKPHDVCLICAATFNDRFTVQHVKKLLTDQLGAVQFETPPFSFEFTSYYADEMGTQLKKTFFSFSRLIAPQELIGVKLATNKLEAETATQNRRSINYDPGYIEAAKLVLATTKNFDHRLYLGDGIYGDVQLRFRNKAFTAMDWTYPDYQQESVLNFFYKVRSWYLQQLASPKEKRNDKI